MPTTEPLQRLTVEAERSRVGFVAVELGGVRRTLVLEPRAVRAPGFALVVPATAPADVRATLEGEQATYRGFVDGMESSQVAATLLDGRVLARIDAPDIGTWFVQPEPGDDPALHKVYASFDARSRLVQCWDEPGDRGSDRGSSALAPLAPVLVTPPDAPPSYGTAPFKICQIAVDVDHEFYLWQGANTAAYVESVINAANVTFESQLQMTMQLTGLVVRTDPGSDPYPQTGSLCFVAKSVWEDQHVNIPRDVVNVFFSGGGSACATKIGFTTCSHYASAATVTDLAGNLWLFLHENGHLLGSPHCNGGPTCSIMCGGAYPAVTLYCPQELVHLEPFVANTPHLTTSIPTAPPTLGSVSPTVVAAPSGPLTLTGSGFYDAHFVTVHDGSAIYNLPRCELTISSDTQIMLDPPFGPVLGPIRMSVHNSFGRSSSVTVQYVATNPPVVVAPAYSSSQQLVEWDMYGLQAATANLRIALNDPSTVDMNGFQVLANPTFADVTTTLNTVGQATHQQNFTGVLLHAQLVLRDASGSVIAASTVKTTSPPLGG